MASASSIVAIFSLVFWSFQLAPQAILNYRRQSTDGLSPLLLLSWSIASSLTAVNNIATRLSPLFIIQPNLFLAFSITCYTQCYYYPSTTTTDTTTTTDDTASPPRPTPLCAAIHGTAALLACLTIQLALALPLLPHHPTPTSPSLLAVNILSLLLFLAAFIPQYAELWRSGGKAAAGVSLLFLCVDMSGAVLSIVALALTGGFEVVEAVCYIGVFVGDGVIVCVKLCLPQQAARLDTNVPDNKQQQQQVEVEQPQQSEMTVDMMKGEQAVIAKA